MDRTMDKPESTMADRVCWVAIAVAICTLGLLLWLFD